MSSNLIFLLTTLRLSGEQSKKLIKILNEFASTLNENDFTGRTELRTFALKNDIIIEEGDESMGYQMEIVENPTKIFEEIVKIVKSANNYFNIYLKKNLLPIPSAQDFTKNSLEKKKQESRKKQEFEFFQEEKTFQTSNFSGTSLENEVKPLVFTEKLAKALGMKSIYSPPPYFDKLAEMGVPYYYKKKRMRYYGLNDYLPQNFPRNEWRKTKINKKWLRKTPEPNDQICSNEEKWDSDVILDESKDVENEINKHIRCAVPLYAEVEVQHISDDE